MMERRGGAWTKAAVLIAPTILLSVACSSEETAEPADAALDATPADAALPDAAVFDAGPEVFNVCDPASKPADCGACWPTGADHCGGTVWSCGPDGDWVQLTCDPAEFDAAACGALNASAPDASAGDASAQAYCEPDWANPVECPSYEPAPGAACALDGLECVYPGTDGHAVDLLRCEGTAWYSTFALCNEDCDVPQGGVVLSGPWPACGAGADVACATGSTDQGALDGIVAGVAECCGGLVENRVMVWFEDGCVSGAWLARPAIYSDFEACFVTLIAGRRFSCAASLGCAQASWSTVVTP